MKILHTSDWHLGHRLHEQSQYEEQSQFLDWLETYIKREEISILLVSGDIFDTGVPSTQSQKMYYDFLIKLIHSSCKHVVITGGNHDAPGTINAPKELLSALQVQVVGKVTENVEDEVFQLSVGDEQVIVAAVPYMRDQDIRRAVAGESFDDIGDRYKMALVNHYTEVGAYCESIKTENVPVIGMGHLFAIGGSTSESEQSIYVGNLGDIGAEDFPKIFDYIALGHLHRPQKAGGTNHIRYSGSPTILSFSEIGYEKNVILIETDGGKPLKIENVIVPKFREVLRVKGSVDECITHLQQIDKETYSLKPWVEVVIDNQMNAKIENQEINKAAEDLNLEVLKISLKNERNIQGLEALLESSKQIKELQPLEVFKMKCKEQNFDIDENVEIFDAFNEALQIAREN
ncbi:exonuclease SbcCD subunit D C-terminal domain-containing protein [Ancylomarina sp. 16SWW S1-10-2]|uniref:exonuclease SbcCD subunit D C-terminal domain-containing protein n=1 Tax=Ancylomarina sp. 16SWW S1-10-2 TaxID=2499681 RepID=UPI0012AD6382|nr:exonuclease SbcCD subunit D C-terminal domain-containing protein [Ancylomarina sp. 16SWW S1-10-2]MRT93921.1 exonuclease subunit SbcD [Ancylomarina sp. 16SWW S1-10-2]